MKRAALLRRSPLRKSRSKPRPGRLPRKEYALLREAVYERDKWKCRACNRTRGGLHAHHRIYRSHGGPDTMENILTVCHVCHSDIHDGRLWIIGDYPNERFTNIKPEK